MPAPDVILIYNQFGEQTVAGTPVAATRRLPVTTTGAGLKKTFGRPMAQTGDYQTRTDVETSEYVDVPLDFPAVYQSDMAFFRRSLIGKVPAVPAGTFARPAAPTVTNVGTPGSTTYTYLMSAVHPSLGETRPSLAGTTTTGNATLSAANYNHIVGVAVPGATLYKFFKAVGTALLGVSRTPVLDDIGQATTVYVPAGADPVAYSHIFSSAFVPATNAQSLFTTERYDGSTGFQIADCEADSSTLTTTGDALVTARIGAFGKTYVPNAMTAALAQQSLDPLVSAMKSIAVGEAGSPVAVDAALYGAVWTLGNGKRRIPLGNNSLVYKQTSRQKWAATLELSLAMATADFQGANFRSNVEQHWRFALQGYQVTGTVYEGFTLDAFGRIYTYDEQEYDGVTGFRALLTPKVSGVLGYAWQETWINNIAAY